AGRSAELHRRDAGYGGNHRTLNPVVDRRRAAQVALPRRFGDVERQRAFDLAVSVIVADRAVVEPRARRIARGEWRAQSIDQAEEVRIVRSARGDVGELARRDLLVAILVEFLREDVVFVDVTVLVVVAVTGGDCGAVLCGVARCNPAVVTA